MEGIKFECKKKVKKTVEEINTYILEEYWVVRVVYENGGKQCVGEQEFDHEPSPSEVASVLTKWDYCIDKCFASVVRNYRFVEEGKNNEN